MDEEVWKGNKDLEKRGGVWDRRSDLQAAWPRARVPPLPGEGGRMAVAHSHTGSPQLLC